MKRFLIAAVLLTVALPLGTVAARNAHSPPSAHTTTLAPLALAQRDQQDLAAARPDARNLYDLTRRLKLHSLAPINPYVRSTAPNYAVGRVDTFWVARATSGYFSLKAKLLLKTPHAYWYVQENMGIPQARLMAALRISAHDFETHVYPMDHAAFGHEWTPGVDRDPRITVLCANLPGVGGYYSAEDLYPRAVNPFSNQRKMLYVNITAFALGSRDFASTIAHELQHMIHWYQHERDDTWINEGSSVLAQVLTGYTPDGQDQAFAADPGTQLNDFCYGPPGCSDGDAYAHYGAAFLWMYYLYQHYGGDRAIRAVLADKNLSGMALFDDVLARLGSRDRARDAFRKWVIANLVDDPGIAGGAYGYRPTYHGCCIHARITASTSSYPFTHRARVNQFATNYVELTPGRASTLHLQFKGDSTVRIVPNTPLQDGLEWWSNRGDEMDSTLTRALDLRHVRHATLQYDIWHAVEKDFDYGYVEVSTDGGRTWYTVHGRTTTNANPNGSNYGNGYTGYSTKKAGNHSGWLHESIDLSPYAGRRILVRFEHITDDAFNLSGITLDNIRVPEIGFVDRPGTSGWQTHGWVRVANLLPTHWLVQLVLYTRQGVQVRQMPLSATADGQATVTGLGHDVRRVVVAISPTAPQTTIPSGYTLTVR
jgi:immune inhibitor A